MSGTMKEVKRLRNNKSNTFECRDLEIVSFIIFFDEQSTRLMITGWTDCHCNLTEKAGNRAKTALKISQGITHFKHTYKKV